MMKKIEAKTLEEAYSIACNEFACSMKELKYEIVQYPSKGVLGLFAKPAIIVAAAEKIAVSAPTPPQSQEKSTLESFEEQEKSFEKSVEAKPLQASIQKRTSEGSGAVEKIVEKKRAPKSLREPSEERILEGFFGEEKSEGHSKEIEEPAASSIGEEIEEKLKNLMKKSCFDMDVVEVDVIDDTAYVFIDGEDAALLIGKEGYRYNAFSYLLYTWIHGCYNLYVKLEVASFLSSQQEMMRSSLSQLIEHVREKGGGRTRPLDGILVRIALEQLREAFPNKYVAIKRQRDGKSYVLINDFNKRQ